MITTVMDIGGYDAAHSRGSTHIRVNNDHYDAATVDQLARTLAVEVLHLSLSDEGWSFFGGYTKESLDLWRELDWVLRFEIPKYDEAKQKDTAKDD